MIRRMGSARFQLDLRMRLQLVRVPRLRGLGLISICAKLRKRRPVPKHTKALLFCQGQGSVRHIKYADVQAMAPSKGRRL
jgi:hypothetical protein